MSKKLVAYFSASGITAKVAEDLADAIGADIFEIFLIIKSCVPLTNILDFKIQTLRQFLNLIGRSSALLVKESLVTTSLKLFSIVGKRPYITTDSHSYGMKSSKYSSLFFDMPHSYPLRFN